MNLICQPKLTIDVAPCFVLPDNQSLVDVTVRDRLSCWKIIFPNIKSCLETGTNPIYVTPRACKQIIHISTLTCGFINSRLLQ
jgi:hypothetical protein